MKFRLLDHFLYKPIRLNSLYSLKKQRKRFLEVKLVKAKEKFNEAIKYENKLFLMDRQLKAKEESLTKREVELEKEKIEYKEKMKSDFLETIKSKFPLEQL